MCNSRIPGGCRGGQRNLRPDTREGAGLAGGRLKVPVVSKSPGEAAAHFGWLAMFAGFDMPASSAQTQERLGWHPTGPGLIADLDQTSYFKAA